MNAAFIQNIGPTELLILLFLVLLLFGAKRLPDLARSLGKSLGEFKKGREEGSKEASLLDDTRNAADKDAGKNGKKS